MHKFLLTVLIASVAGFATGQTTTIQPTPSTPRTRTTTTPPAATPRTQPTPSTYNPNTATKPQLTPKSGALQPDAASTRAATAKSGATRPESSVERSTSNTATRPSRTPSTKKTTTRYNGSGTARTVTTPAKKTVAPKPVPPPAAPVKINWITLEEALEKSKTEKRKIFVDVMTDWCGWCKRMDETTFTDPAVAQYLNDHFYAVKFNAEQNNDIVFQNKTYRFKSSNGRGYHELAAEWLNNRLSFPTSVFLDESLNLIQPLPGYQDASKLQAILNYFGTDSHRTTPWETYQKNFVSQR